MMSTAPAIAMALVALVAAAAADSIEIPCKEFHPSLDYPCKCSLNAVNATRINCDGAVFAEFPLLPYRDGWMSNAVGTENAAHLRGGLLSHFITPFLPHCLSVRLGYFYDCPSKLAVRTHTNDELAMLP